MLGNEVLLMVVVDVRGDVFVCYNVWFVVFDDVLVVVLVLLVDV